MRNWFSRKESVGQSPRKRIDSARFDLEADLKWCRENNPYLLREFSVKFILVLNQQVLAAANSERKLLRRAKALGFGADDSFLVMSVRVRKEPRSSVVF